MEKIINNFLNNLFKKEIINEVTTSQIESGLSVKIGFSVLFRINTRLKTIYRIEIPYTNLCDKIDYIEFNQDSQKIWIDVFKSDNELINALTNLSEIIKSRGENLFLGKIDMSFGCCSKYEECSNLGHCIMNENDKFYKGCQYKKNLELGNIFYGYKRNYFNKKI